MATLKTVHQCDHFRLGRRNVAMSRAWRIQGLNQPKDTIPGERAVIEPWAGEII
jgi:hypothetical protein